MHHIGILILCLAPALATAAEPADDVRQTKIAFARAFAERDHPRFFSSILDDASFLSPGGEMLAGKKAIVEKWTKYLEPSAAPFSWRPERAVVNGGGTIGLSTGPVSDADGAQIGAYSSIWLKQTDGSWKILFDGRGCSAPLRKPSG